MFRLVRVRDVVRVPPTDFGKDLKEIAYTQLRERYIGKVSQDLGLIVGVWDIEVEPEGEILPADGATYHYAEFTLITFYPMRDEVVEGPVSNVQRYGIFVTIGPIDALVHISQLGDDRFVYDHAKGTFTGEQTKVTIGLNDIVRGQITSVSIAPPSTIKVGMTLRRPGLGKVGRLGG